jgi:hypothetical protein
MSFNVRMDTEKDGDNRWDNRKEVVAGIIRNQKPAVFGLQVIQIHACFCVCMLLCSSAHDWLVVAC